MDLKALKIEAEKATNQAKNLAELEEVSKKFLSKKGELARFFVELKNLPAVERKQAGQKANLIKQEIEKLLAEKTSQLRQKENQIKLSGEKIDVTRPGQKIETGHLHPLTLIQKEAIDIFQSMGFAVVSGPEMETEWYNFDALNIPAHHPARDMWDTFWLRQKEVKSQKSKVKSKSEKLLLRTHTSPVQIRYMEKHNPPLKIIVPGRVFRHEATDSSHEAQFYQLEGLMVDSHISVANFKAIITEFLKRFFKAEIAIRLRPSFFPFTEPSFEIDVKRPDKGWLELMGAGMVHPNVFKSAGYNPKGLQGFAFGVGLDRLAMIKYKVSDIRLFYQNDLRFLKQF